MLIGRQDEGRIHPHGFHAPCSAWIDPVQQPPGFGDRCRGLVVDTAVLDQLLDGATFDPLGDVDARGGAVAPKHGQTIVRGVGAWIQDDVCAHTDQARQVARDRLQMLLHVGVGVSHGGRISFYFLLLMATAGARRRLIALSIMPRYRYWCFGVGEWYRAMALAMLPVCRKACA